MVIQGLGAAISGLSRFLFTTKTGIALTAGTVGLNIGQNSVYGAGMMGHPGMSMLGGYGGMGYM